MTLTEYIERLEKLVEKATPGRWKSQDTSPSRGEVTSKDKRVCFNFQKGPEDVYNIQFIAAARTAVPLLCRMLKNAVDYISWRQESLCGGPKGCNCHDCYNLQTIEAMLKENKEKK